MKNIVIRPRISEKSLTLAAFGWYTFVVSIESRKEQIVKKIEALYGVTVTNIRTISMHGKERHVGKMRRLTHLSNWKKALVTLAKGQKIDAFEVTTEKNTK